MAESPRFGYGTNGFANHRLDDALAVLADLGYQGVALTLDHDHLDPYAPGLAARVATVGHRLAELDLGVVIETGARYLLDPWHKHAPTLLDDDPAPRIDFLCRAVAIGADLGAEAVSWWAGVRPAHVDEATAWERLVAGCAEVVAVADSADVTVGFEPEPGMLVPDIAGWWRLRGALGAPPGVGITLDIGHCRCPTVSTRSARTWSTCRSRTCAGGCTSIWSSATVRSTSRRCCAPWPTSATGV